MRNECTRPYRIYRPGFVVGDSKTGDIDKIDGPYYFFKTLQKMRDMLPPWMPMIGIEGGRINIVPVDFVADAIDHLAHKQGLDGQCFHLTDPEPHRIGEVLNIFARAGHAPQMTMRLNARMFGFIPRADPLRPRLACRRSSGWSARCCTDLGIPKDVFQFINWPTRYDNREAAKALKGSGITRAAARRLRWRSCGTTGSATSTRISSSIVRSAGRVKGKVVVITGGSSGIGKATALKIAAAGAPGDPRRPRRGEAAARRKKEIDAAGGTRAGSTRPTSPTWRRATRWSRACWPSTAACDYPGQQRRPLDPPRRSINSLRPLPRFRAHDAAQLFRRAAPDHGLPAEDDRAASAATSSTSRRSAC